MNRLEEKRAKLSMDDGDILPAQMKEVKEQSEKFIKYVKSKGPNISQTTKERLDLVQQLYRKD